MKITATIEQRYERTPDGAVWTPAQFPYAFWAQYLEVFDAVRVMARVHEVDQVPPQYQRVDGRQVTVCALPHYIGALQYLKQRARLLRTVRAAARPDQAYLLRLSSPLGSLVQPILQSAAWPYGVEVVSDPFDIFAPGVIKHPLAPLLRRLFSSRLRKECAGAAVAAYVTNTYLQKRYPNRGRCFSLSDVHIADEDLAAAPRVWRAGQPRFALVFVGSLAQLYKAPDLLIRAVGRCVRDGLDLCLTMIGEGKYRPAMEALAEREGLAGRVVCAGQVMDRAVLRACLDQADLFVLPSRTEGLPRALIEAMARGLACIASTAGGIPDLLAAEDLVPPGDLAALTDKLKEVLGSAPRLCAMSQRNLKRAGDYHSSLMRQKKLEFLTAIKDATPR